MTPTLIRLVVKNFHDDIEKNKDSKSKSQEKKWLLLYVIGIISLIFFGYIGIGILRLKGVL